MAGAVNSQQNGSVNQTILSLASPTLVQPKSPTTLIAVVIASVFQNATPPAPPFCTGVSGGGLTWTLRGRATFNSGSQTNAEISIWYASATGAVNAAFTAAFSGLNGTNNFFAGVSINILSYTGCKTPSAPFDPGVTPAFNTAVAANLTTTKDLCRGIGTTVTTVANNNTVISGPATWTIQSQNGMNPGGGAVIADSTTQDTPIPHASTLATPFTYASGSGATIVYTDAIQGF